MNKLSHSVLWIVTVLVTACNIQPKQEPIEEVIDRGLKASTEQALLMAKELETQNGRLPKTINKEGKLETSDYSWWCSVVFVRIKSDPGNEKICRNVHRPCRRGKTHHLQP